MHKIACFISPHGFGHATRTIAMLESLQHLVPDLLPLVITTVPQHLFAESLGLFSYHQRVVDIGMVQNSALTADIPATIKRLDDFLPFLNPSLTILRRSAGNVPSSSAILPRSG